MYILISHYQHTKLFYRFSEDKKDLYCVATDSIETCKKYSEQEYQELKSNELLKTKKVIFEKL